MSTPQTTFRVAPGIVHEVFDDEVVIINLDSGSYFSLSGAGQVVWSTLGPGASIDTIVDDVLSRFDGDPGTVRADVEALAERLLDEKLVEAVAASNGHAPRSDDAPKRPYASPQLATFTDMQELLRLDPIHDVDETGWPNRPD